MSDVSYCELHAHSCYSLLDGVPWPHELAERAHELGLPAIALTDNDAIYGATEFFARANELGIKPILGTELTLDDDCRLTLLAETQAGYSSLCRLITAGRASRPKGESALAWDQLAGNTNGLICLTGGRQGPLARLLIARQPTQASAALDKIRGLFGQANVYVELNRNLQLLDEPLGRRLSELAFGHGLKCVATGDVHYLTPDDADVHDALISIRTRTPIPRGRRANREFYLRAPAAMAALYPDIPEAVKNTLEVAERCRVTLPTGLQVLPRYPTPPGVSAQDYLRRLCVRQLPELYPHNTTKARALLEKELGMIGQLGLANYFLIVWDIVNFCRRRGILCNGRGSAANSLVARLLGISAVDPIAQDLVVERFLSVEKGGTPDIDLDIDAKRRETVIQYIYDRWGRDHVAMACTFITFRSASAIRDAGFALGFKAETVEQLVQTLDAQRPSGVPGSGAGHPPGSDSQPEGPDVPLAEIGAQQPPNSGLTSVEWQRLLYLADRLHRRPRHLGLHNGGMVVTGDSIASLLAVEPARLENRTVTQMDKENLERRGIVKIDVLGLRMLSAIADAQMLIQREHGQTVVLDRLDGRDPRVYDLICSAKTIGIFQVESGAQVSILPHMQPRSFQDLVVEISLIRPGPLQGNMVRPYILRRRGLEPITYLHPKLRRALASTLGIMVFQEQVIQVAQDFAGFTADRGETLRSAMGHKYAADELQKFHEEFVRGAVAGGAAPNIAEQVWQMVAGFAGYSFSKAHACQFAMIVYWSAWLRLYYPTEYFCGLLRNVPMGTYPASVLEAEAKRVGVKFLGFDINHSQAQTTVENGAIRYGLDFVHGIGDERAEAIVQLRGEQPFTTLADFATRTKVDRRVAESLVIAGAFEAFGTGERRQLLWNLAEAYDVVHQLPQLALGIPDEDERLEPMTAERKTLRAYFATGVTVGAHLTELRRDAFARAGCLPYRELAKRSGKVRVGGMVADGLRRPPTAKGTSFLRIEMTEGLVDVIVPPAVYAECRQALRSLFVVVEGTLRRNGPVLSVTATKVSALP